MLPMTLPKLGFFGLPPLFSSISNQKSKQLTPAQLLLQRKRPISYSLDKFRSEELHAVDLQTEIEQLTRHQKLTGRWKKDKHASDSMDEACELVQLPWVLRKAINVLDILEVEDTDAYFKTNIKAGGIMDVVERYPWSGEPVDHPRRDKRRGKHRAYVTRTEEGPCIVCTWEDPHGGDCTDCFILSDCGNVLTQASSMTIRGTGRSTQYKTVYRRVHH